MAAKDKKILEVKNLTKFFPVKKDFFGTSHSMVKAVDNVSFYINKGETLGLVGESGCGKTTTGRTILRLHEPTAGEIIFEGNNITEADMKPLRKKMQIIFQDPYASLNPRMTVGDIIGEPMEIHDLEKGSQRKDKIYQLLEMVGLNREHASRYPHEFSGGQRQRVGIARALAVKPEFIVCDEPISALDVSIQAQIVNMLEDLQASLGLTYLFIAHDLSMVKHISDKVGVMYLGKLIELADSEEIYSKPAHPYTQALLSSIPIADPSESRKKKRIILEGDVPSPINPPSGCRFRTRCRYSMKKCEELEPEFKEISIGHFCACHLVSE
ncbi:MAG: dipeptide ABC transporter ATP-binding protein [Clostridia bacterium]|nr:dipeptide ABC transporter ATP-binding protein [Clostridia bacterium]